MSTKPTQPSTSESARSASSGWVAWRAQPWPPKSVFLLLFKPVFLILFAGAALAEPETRPLAAVGLGGFSPSLFQFVTIIPDKGGEAGGWQESFAVLKFFDGRQDPVRKWTCSVRVGMPLRTRLLGSVSPTQAAIWTAEVATDASSVVMHRQPSWLTAEYCLAFHAEMRLRFDDYYKGLGARIRQN